jgi:predicted RNase H-like HicB family nuclease
MQDVMPEDYVEAALARAEYEVIEGIAPLYGEVPGLQGAWATGPSIQFCRENLEEVVTDWVIFRVARKFPIPSVEELGDRWPPSRKPVPLQDADGPVQWPELVHKMNAAGFEGPFWRGNQPFVVRGTVTVRLPIPERALVDLDLLSRILGHAGVTREEWATL